MAPDERQEIMRFLADWRESNAEKLGGIVARLDEAIHATRDHEARIRELEQNTVTREELEEIVKSAVSSGIAVARRPSFRDMGMFVTILISSAMLLATVATAVILWAQGGG